MGALGATDRDAGLIGRDRERALLDRLLASARAGDSGSLVIRGEAGIGKTALLDHAVAHAQQMTVLRVTGVEAEADLAFAGIYGLLRPVVGKLDELPATQAAAVAGALGLAPSTGADRFLVSAGVLGLLAAAAEDGPILCAVDDAQWLDRPSADALVFAARRLRAERVAIVFAAHDGEQRRFEASGIPELRLAGLDEHSSGLLLVDRAGGAAPGVRKRLLSEVAGNPLALLELPAGLSDSQLAGTDPLPESMPLTARLHAAFQRRMEVLADGTRMALLVAASDDTGELAVVLGALQQLGLQPDVLDPAERAGLISTASGAVAFRHPLVRSALADGATLSERRRAHAALAATLSGEEQADRRAWHQAMAAISADEQVAAALDASAQRAQRRAGHASAATAFQRAAELTPEDSNRAQRLVRAAQTAWDGGQAARARELTARASALADADLRVRLLHLDGVIEMRSGNVREAAGILARGAAESTDRSLALEMLLEGSEAASYAGDYLRVAELGARAMEIEPFGERDRFIVAVLTGFAKEFAGEHAHAQSMLREAISMATMLDDPRALVWASNAAAVGGDLGDGLDFATRAVDLARKRGLLSLLPKALEQQSMYLIENSRFDAAYAAAEEAYRLSLDVGHGSG